MKQIEDQINRIREELTEFEATLPPAPAASRAPRRRKSICTGAFVTKRNRRVSCGYATVASPFFSTSDSSLSEAPEGRFSPRSHLLTRLLVTFR